MNARTMLAAALAATLVSCCVTRWEEPRKVGVIRSATVLRGAWNSEDVTVIETDRGDFTIDGIHSVAYGDTLSECWSTDAGVHEVSWTSSRSWFRAFR